MKSRNLIWQVTIKTAIALCVVAGGLQVALAQGVRPTHDSLIGLKRALQEANAPALTTDQETQLKTLITAYHENNRPQGPSTELQAARKAYNEAILAGNADAAKAAEAQIAGLIATAEAARAQARITFELAALTILNGGGNATGPQVTALVQKFGEGKVIGLIDSLAGGGFGPFFGGGPRGGFAPFGAAGHPFPPGH